MCGKTLRLAIFKVCAFADTNQQDLFKAAVGQGLRRQGFTEFAGKVGAFDLLIERGL